MEQALEDLARKALLEPRFRALLDAVCVTRDVDLPTLLSARDQDKLEELLLKLEDPLLHDAIDECLEMWQDNRHNAYGLNTLRQYVPRRARLSYIANGKTITELCRRVEVERNILRNSVRRRFLQAISKLLIHHLGKSVRNRIFDDVDYPAEDDTRKVSLNPAEIRRLLEACEESNDFELGIVIRLALLTSADRGVLLSGCYEGNKKARGLLRRDLRIEMENNKLSGAITLEDRKTESRTRTVPLTHSLCAALLPLAIDKEPDDPVFGMTYSQLDHRWRIVREMAGLKHVRFKDLRAQISQYGEEAGVPLTILQATMGHSDVQMTRRYQQRQSVMSTEQVRKIEEAMDLSDASDDENVQPTIEPTMSLQRRRSHTRKSIKEADLRERKPASSQCPKEDSNLHGLAAT
jgi:integrase